MRDLAATSSRAICSAGPCPTTANQIPWASAPSALRANSTPSADPFGEPFLELQLQ